MPPRVASFLAGAALVFPGLALAQDWRPGGAYLAEGGVSVHGTAMAALGAWWPWKGAGAPAQADSSWSVATEAWLAHWRAREPGGGHASFTQLAVSPMLRWRWAGGASPWFIEAGAGLSLNDRRYRRERKQFSTTWNFVDTLGLGLSFGAAGEQDISLRLMHVSNAGLREPNPGENFLLLRYARRF